MFLVRCQPPSRASILIAVEGFTYLWNKPTNGTIVGLTPGAPRGRKPACSGDELLSPKQPALRKPF